MTAGRPKEGRIRLSIHVLPDTANEISKLVDKSDIKRNTQGKVIDLQFIKTSLSKKK